MSIGITWLNWPFIGHWSSLSSSMWNEKYAPLLHWAVDQPSVAFVQDFWEMFLHHIATISLLSFSYIVNFVRVGSLVLLIHDCGDVWLEVREKALIDDGIACIFLFSDRAPKWRSMLEHKRFVIHYSLSLLWCGSSHVFVSIHTSKSSSEPWANIFRWVDLTMCS